MGGWVGGWMDGWMYIRICTCVCVHVQPHAVEASQGTRRVLVGYTPRELGRLPIDLREFLLGLSFPLPPTDSLPPAAEPLSDSAEVEAEGPKLREDVLSDSEVHQFRCEHAMLRHLLIEQHKCYDEEVAGVYVFI